MEISRNTIDEAIQESRNIVEQVNERRRIVRWSSANRSCQGNYNTVLTRIKELTNGYCPPCAKKISDAYFSSIKI